jgi:hypothetical protein
VIAVLPLDSRRWDHGERAELLYLRGGDRTLYRSSEHRTAAGGFKRATAPEVIGLIKGRPRWTRRVASMPFVRVWPLVLR